MRNRNVLIVEDDRAYATVLATRCQQLGLGPRIANNVEDAVRMLAERRPHLILLDIGIPFSAGRDQGQHGLVVCEHLDQTALEDVPVIVLSGRGDDEAASRARLAGATFVKKSPTAWATLQDEITRLLGLDQRPAETTVRTDAAHVGPTLDGAPANGPSVLCIDDDPDVNVAIGMRLKQLGARPRRAFSGAQGIQLAHDELPDLIVTDLNMPDGSGNYVIGRLKSSPVTKNVPIIVLTGTCNPGVARELRTLGAEAVLLKPLDLARMIGEMSRFVTFPRQRVAART